MAHGRKKRKIGHQDVTSDGKNNGDCDKENLDGKAALDARKSLFKAPDATEVLEISHTRNHFKSNLFRLQLQELVREIRHPASPKLETFLRCLQPLLLELKPGNIQPDFAKEFPHLRFHQRVPLPGPVPFSAPKAVDVVGSFLLGTCLRSDFHVDLAVEMPPEMFQSRDHLNFRYLDKRAAYVGELGRRLSTCQGPLAGMKVHYVALQGDVFRPSLVLRHGDAWEVRLLPACCTLATSKLRPDMNAVRPDASQDKATWPATALYNSCLLEDSHMRRHLEYLHTAIVKMPGLSDAILLLKRWAIARGFVPQSHGVALFTPLTGFCLSIVAAHAAMTTTVSSSEASSFQLFKMSLAVFAQVDWHTQKVVLGEAVAHPLSVEEQRLCGAHFYDGGLNIFWRLGPFMDEIRHEAQKTLATLDSVADPYDAVFSISCPAVAWDVVLRTGHLDVSAFCPDPNVAKITGEEHSYPRDAPQVMALSSRLLTVISKGLGDRCVRTAARYIGQAKLHLQSECQGPAVLACFTLNPLNVDRVIDKGPSSQDTEGAERFRALWGADKAELRRFRDGAILESAVWAKPPPSCFESKKHPAVVTQILHHLVGRHFAQVKEVEVSAGPIGLTTNLREDGLRLWRAFETAREHLCQLSSLPLAVKTVHPSGAAFSHLDISQIPAPDADGMKRSLHNVVVEFESSGRWPENPTAAQKVACAMFLQMQEELSTDLGIESRVTETFLDVLYPEFTFRLHIFHPSELTSVASFVTDGAGGTPPDDESLEKLRTRWWRPRLSAAMRAAVLQKPAMAGATRLFKQWMASQMFSGYDEFVEHLASAVFLPSAAPTSSHAGFTHMCRLLATFDWRSEPLIVDFDGKISDAEKLRMRQSFEARVEEGEHSSTGVSFWITSRFDPHARLLPTPLGVAAMWLQQRAVFALDVCHRHLLGLSSGWKDLFAVDMSFFDIVIKCGRRDGVKEEAALEATSQIVVRKLRTHLNPVCLVFCNAQNHTIALKWRPHAFLPQPTSVLVGAVPHLLLSGDEAPQMCVPDILYLTSAVASLTEGLATEVTIVSA